MDAQELWDELVARLDQDVDPEVLEAYFSHTQATGVDDTTLRVEVANRYYLEWIKDNYLPLLKGYVADVAGRPLDITLLSPDTDVEAAPRPLAGRSPSLNTAHTFESFVVGECNRMAHAAALAVCDNPGRTYNPLYLFGASGLGKTHLMHAIGNEIARRQPGANVVYATTEEFTNDLINAIRYKRTDQFRSRFRSSNTVLLLDDIQFLSGKARTQEELFHTFNALQASGRQIVLTSDVEPDQIADLQPRLVTRFAGGLVADLQPPDPETLLAILHRKADLAGLVLPLDLAQAIADGSRGSIREVEGMLARLGMIAKVEGKPLSLELARKALPRLFAPPAPVVSVAAIIEMVARLANLRSADLTGHGRSRALTRPRQIAMYLARKHTPLSFPELAREFGNRDHTTIVHGVKKVEQDVKRDPDLAYQIQLVEQSLGLRPR